MIAENQGRPQNAHQGSSRWRVGIDLEKVAKLTFLILYSFRLASSHFGQKTFLCQFRRLLIKQTNLFDDSKKKKKGPLRGRDQGCYRLRAKLLLPLLYSLGVSFPVLTIASFSCDLGFHFYDSQVPEVERRTWSRLPIVLSYPCKFSLCLHNEGANSIASPSGFGIIHVAAIQAGQYNHFLIFSSAPCPSEVMEWEWVSL